MPIHVIVQYCTHKLPQRVAEYDECVRRNLANPHVAMVHNLVEPQTVVPAEFKAHAKYKESLLPRWMTYKDAFDYASANLAGEIVCLCNLDIFLDAESPWDDTRAILKDKVVLCQSRLEFDPSGPAYKDPGFDRIAFAIAQDAWVFIPPIDVANCDFEIGTLGCDNAIAHRIKKAGLLPVNLADRFRIFHFDRARGKTALNQVKVQSGETQRRVNRHPEREGYYLVPNLDRLESVDKILDELKINGLDRYKIICFLLTRFTAIENEYS